MFEDLVVFDEDALAQMVLREVEGWCPGAGPLRFHIYVDGERVLDMDGIEIKAVVSLPTIFEGEEGAR